MGTFAWWERVRKSWFVGLRHLCVGSVRLAVALAFRRRVLRRLPGHADDECSASRLTRLLLLCEVIDEADAMNEALE